MGNHAQLKLPRLPSSGSFISRDFAPRDSLPLPFLLTGSSDYLVHAGLEPLSDVILNLLSRRQDFPAILLERWPIALRVYELNCFYYKKSHRLSRDVVRGRVITGTMPCLRICLSPPSYYTYWLRMGKVTLDRSSSVLAQRWSCEGEKQGGRVKGCGPCRRCNDVATQRPQNLKHVESDG